MKLEPHPMANASLIEVMDYLALRLAEVRDANADDRNLRNASDRYDEAYMWVVAWVSSQADLPAPAVDAVPAGEGINGYILFYLPPVGVWYVHSHKIYPTFEAAAAGADRFLLPGTPYAIRSVAALSHGEGR